MRINIRQQIYYEINSVFKIIHLSVNQLAKWLQLETALGPSYEVVAMKYSSYTTLEGGCND